MSKGVRVAIVLLAVVACATGAALAQRHMGGGGGGRGMAGGDGAGQPRRCPPGVTFNMCWQHCINMSGTARTDMMACDKRCTNRGCPADTREQPALWSR